MSREKKDQLSKEELVKMMEVMEEGVSSSLFESLKRLIVSGKIPVGFKFPCENVFCDLLGVSRGSLREAYIKLEAIGMISRSRGGTIVQNPNSLQSIDTLIQTSLSSSEMSNVLEYRTLLEAEVCALAAERALPDEIKSLSWLLDQMRESVDDTTVFSHYDMLFHMRIAEMSKNVLFKDSVANVTQFWLRFIYQVFAGEPEAKNDALRCHEIIYDAIAMKSPGLAKESMRMHVSNISGFSNMIEMDSESDKTTE